ncbi:MAG: 50S ribosomal protein L9 [Anaerolineae bacterium]|nr:50S ribosomal protein L9 [Anaerolineae bacterium]
MKVILTEDVYKHGVAGEVVEVADGFARNYLIPKGFAIKATAGAMKQAAKLRKDAVARRARVHKELTGIAELIEGEELYFGVKAGNTGKLYGSVTMGDVADALIKKLSVEVDRRRVGEGVSLRELGEHNVRVRLAADLNPVVKVIIHREGESPETVRRAIQEESASAEAVTAEVEETQPAEE